MNDKILYIFIDEGGNLNFSSSGSRYFTLTALSKIRPFSIYEPLVNLKYDLWEKGIDFEYFHATEDTQHTRDEVFKLISTNLSKFTVDSLIVEKRKTHPSLQDHGRFYQKIFEILLNYVLTRYTTRFRHIFIVTDSIPLKRKKAELQKAIKKYVSDWAQTSGGSYKIYHYASKSDINLQIVDYFNWAIFRKWERQDGRSYVIIKDTVFSEFDLFAEGKNFYYP